MRVLIMALPVLVLAQVPDQPLAPSGSNHHPTDVPKRHVEQIAGGRHAYSVRQGGTMDGTNCRSPLAWDDGRAGDQSRPGNRTARSGSRTWETRTLSTLVVKRP